ncbi:MAG: hypothetical protein ABIG95_03220 [Candidatus Woesearchaeota archaeon]
MKRAAVELSANFLVVIIIAIVVLSMGIMLARNMFGKVVSIDTKLEYEAEKQVWEMGDTGESVVVPISSKLVKRGEIVVFGVGVRNILDTNQEFNVTVEPKTVGGCSSDADWLISIPRNPRNVTANVQKPEVFTLGILIPKNAPVCKYVFNVGVQNGSQDDYGSIHKIYVDAR